MKYLIPILLILTLFTTACTQTTTGGDAYGNNPDGPFDDPNATAPEGNNNGEPGATEQVQITEQQLSQHNKEEDCWIAYDGKIYDITSFLPKHPGGKGAIIPYCGTSTDFKLAFEGKHGTSNVDKLKEEGELIGDFSTS